MAAPAEVLRVWVSTWLWPCPPVPITPPVTETAGACGSGTEATAPSTPWWVVPVPLVVAKFRCTSVLALNSVVPESPRCSSLSRRTARTRTVVRPCRTTISSPAVMALSLDWSLSGVSSASSSRRTSAQSLPNGLLSSPDFPLRPKLGRRRPPGFQPDSTWDRIDSPRGRLGLGFVPAEPFAAPSTAPFAGVGDTVGAGSGKVWTSVTTADESRRLWSTKLFGCFVVTRGARPPTGSASRSGTATLATVSTCRVTVPWGRPSCVNVTSTS